MNKYLIFGTNGVGKDLCAFIEDDGNEMDAYVLDREYIQEKHFYGKEIVPYDELNERYGKDEVTILVVTGYSKMNENRKKILERCREDGWDVSSFFHSNCLCYAKSIGDGNVIFPYVYIGSDAVIGDGNLIGAYSAIGHDSVVGDYNYFAGADHISGVVKIGNHNFFGESCTVVDQLEMEDYNLIGAGVCLNKNIESHTIAMPNEARIQQMNLKCMDLLLKRAIK